MRKTGKVAAGLWVLLGLAAGERADGCSIPVFRYALERWPAYGYEMIIYHKEAPGPDLTNAVAAIYQTNANVQVHLSKTGPGMDIIFEEVLSKERGVELPWAVVRYPQAYWETVKREVAWSGKFEEKTLARVINSPVREKLGKAILAGASCVWVFVESGNAEVDAAKRKILTDRLEWIEKNVQLPEESHAEVAQGELAGVVPLKVDFEVISVSRENPEEKIFVEMLVKMEPDWEKCKDKPMAFPVFGQGRALWALVGDGITERMVDNAVGFLISFCSCEIKDMNPGVDVLMNVNWLAGVTNLMSVPDAPTNLVGISALAEEARPPPEEKEPAAREEPAVSAAVPGEERADVPAHGGRNRAMWMAGIVAVILGIGLTGALLARGKEE